MKNINLISYKLELKKKILNDFKKYVETVSNKEEFFRKLQMRKIIFYKKYSKHRSMQDLTTLKLLKVNEILKFTKQSTVYDFAVLITENFSYRMSRSRAKTDKQKELHEAKTITKKLKRQAKSEIVNKNFEK